MMIYKYPMHSFEVTIKLPKAAKILDFAYQFTNFCIWALVDPVADTEERTFHIFPTGAEVTGNFKHIGTTLVNDGETVWHCFEKLS